MPQLREIAKKILEKKFSGKPVAMANALNVSEMDVRRITGIDRSSGRNQEKVFQFTLKILPICEELGIDPARNLKPPNVKEILLSELARQKTGSDVAKGTKSTKKARSGIISQGRTKKH